MRDLKSGIGTFLEFSVQTSDIIGSLNFYKTLGFEELEIGDVWSHKYAVASDGVLSIGLHDRDFSSPAVTFVQPELSKHALSMTDHGFNFTRMQLGEEAFNELHFNDRDGHSIMMLEARTYYGGDADDNDSLCGSWFELTLPVREAMRSAHFWAPIAPVVLNRREDPTMRMRFDAGGIAGYEGAFRAITAPEGTCLYLFDEDFLGEGIQVDESDDLSEYLGKV